jgi:hypothetical protein
MIKIQLLLLVLVWNFFSFLLSSQIIWLLVPNYAGLENELVLTVVIFCLNITANVIYTFVDLEDRLSTLLLVLE